MIFNDEVHGKLLRSRLFIDWLTQQAGVSQTHYLQDLYDRRLTAAEMVAAETYHAMARFLDAYPQVASVRPLWFPEIDSSDRSLVIRFRLEIKSRDQADQDDAANRRQMAASAHDPILAFHGYEDYPPSIAAMDTSAYDTLMELAEGVGPELWNEFTPYRLADPERTPYASQAEVMSDMNADLSPFLANLQQWLLEQATTGLSLDAPRASKQRL